MDKIDVCVSKNNKTDLIQLCAQIVRCYKYAVLFFLVQNVSFIILT